MLCCLRIKKTLLLFFVTFGGGLKQTEVALDVEGCRALACNVTEHQRPAPRGSGQELGNESESRMEVFSQLL